MTRRGLSLKVPLASKLYLPVQSHSGHDQSNHRTASKHDGLPVALISSMKIASLFTKAARRSYWGRNYKKQAPFELSP